MSQIKASILIQSIHKQVTINKNYSLRMDSNCIQICFTGQIFALVSDVVKVILSPVSMILQNSENKIRLSDSSNIFLACL